MGNLPRNKWNGVDNELLVASGVSEFVARLPLGGFHGADSLTLARLVQLVKLDQRRIAVRRRKRPPHFHPDRDIIIQRTKIIIFRQRKDKLYMGVVIIPCSSLATWCYSHTFRVLGVIKVKSTKMTFCRIRKIFEYRKDDWLVRTIWFCCKPTHLPITAALKTLSNLTKSYFRTRLSPLRYLILQKSFPRKIFRELFENQGVIATPCLGVIATPCLGVITTPL